MTELEQLQIALASPKQSGKSPLIAEYERSLANYFGAAHVVVVSSGSAAIQTALFALGAKAGRTVIVSAAAPLPTLLPIAATGARIQFVDCRPDNPSIDPDALRSALNETVVAAVEVPLWGYPQDYSDVLAVLKDRRVPLVEDAAQAHGATLAGRFVGTLATIGCFSTHEKKLLSTGEGGFVITDEPEAADRMRKYARLGYLDGASPGMNFKIPAFTAAVGLARLASLDQRVSLKREVRNRILVTLRRLGISELEHVGEPNGYNVVCDLKALKSHEEIHRALATAGIRSDVVDYGYKCGYRHKLFVGTAETCPNAEMLVARLVQLPTDERGGDLIAQQFGSAIAPWL